MDVTSACMLATVLVCNETLWRFQIESRFELTPECMFVLNRAVVENQFITCSALFIRHVIDSSFGSLENALQRNLTCLRKAADFVLRKNTSKVFAEAFEKFRSKEQLLHYVARASDMSIAEARVAVRAMRVFVRENYMRINRVVCHMVECHSGKGTHIDQLPDDCWIAIPKYLKVSDVVGEHGVGTVAAGHPGQRLCLEMLPWYIGIDQVERGMPALGIGSSRREQHDHGLELTKLHEMPMLKFEPRSYESSEKGGVQRSSDGGGLGRGAQRVDSMWAAKMDHNRAARRFLGGVAQLDHE
ncbi:hypothetical protein HPB48_006765 [Haemaphysalis longicornis]|uniref:Uncharacterized protein n=1 Tax=Haemaphysalis longicornis TaxID=44386 RepID=A0A9J6FNA7_HAELO|nr:hypothetical protein HPB48_006765 [Haemaphysalis longicornis]